MIILSGDLEINGAGFDTDIVALEPLKSGEKLRRQFVINGLIDSENLMRGSDIQQIINNLTQSSYV